MGVYMCDGRLRGCELSCFQRTRSPVHSIPSRIERPTAGSQRSISKTDSSRDISTIQDGSGLIVQIRDAFILRVSLLTTFHGRAIRASMNKSTSRAYSTFISVDSKSNTCSPPSSCWCVYVYSLYVQIMDHRNSFYIDYMRLYFIPIFPPGAAAQTEFHFCMTQHSVEKQFRFLSCNLVSFFCFCFCFFPCHNNVRKKIIIVVYILISPTASIIEAFVSLRILLFLCTLIQQLSWIGSTATFFVYKYYVQAEWWTLKYFFVRKCSL